MSTKAKQYDFRSQQKTEPETTRLSSVYSGMAMEMSSIGEGGGSGSGKKFFGAGGKSMFLSINRGSRGHVNSAYQKDDDDQDDDSPDDDRECNSTSTEMYEDDSATVDEISQRTSEEYTTTRVKEPVENGIILNGGIDFKVGFNEVEEQTSSPPRHKKEHMKVPKSWDKFTISPKDNISTTNIVFWEKVFLVTKIVICFLLFFLTLGTAVVSKICFIIITANIFPSDGTTAHSILKTLNGTLQYENQQTNVQWIWALIIMAGAPYIFTSIKSLWRLLFQMTGKRSPSWLVILGVLSIETVHSIGLNIMMFVVIPNLDPISGLLMTLCVGVIPGCMKIFYPTVGPSQLKNAAERPSFMTSAVVSVISIIGAVGQLAAIGLWVFHVYQAFNEEFPSIPYVACMIFAPIFTSVYWWENYVYDGTRTSSGIPKLARHMRNYRTKLTLYASIWKMIITILIPTAVYGFYCDNLSTDCVRTVYFKQDHAELHSGIGNVDLTSIKDFGSCSNYLPLIVAAIGALSGGVCFKVGKIACKIMTQIVDYSLPLVLSTPATLGLILGMYAGFITTKEVGCALPFPVWTDNGSTEYFEQFMDGYQYWFPVLAGLTGFISLLLVTNHVWTPGNERLQRTDKLFIQPLYCGIFLDQSLLLNRRRIEKAKSADSVKLKLTKIPLPDKMNDEEESDNSIFRTSETPMIYLCATMWHETENEMTQLLKSIFRMDEDHCIRKHAQFLLGRRHPDYYEFEAHIFFDDAFEAHKDDEYEFTVNEYVRLLMKTMQVSASAVIDVSFKLKPPVKVTTPYGGRLVWTMPGGNKLIAHLKDKTFIRHRKRWSQVMYMYYFLGYELFNKGLKRRQLQHRAENTYLLALDGDVDFHPKAVQLLVDRMRKNLDVGAACGRIHPIGNGAMVWYQKFEYAVSHWLQKSAEDKFGCVLCSPGCFSLFRGSSLMDENVMAKYTTPPTEPRHYVQYDQGEDRWLCTLLLQQGHRVEYCAASDALTYAPEGFYEFFNQRRRWTPSTMANIMDLLTDWKNVTKKNPEITIAYIFYQGLLMVSSILTPGTIFLMILGAINLAYPVIDMWVALLINALPIVVMVFLCFKAKPETQLTYAAILSTAYSLVMMIVVVGLLRQAAAFGICSVTTFFLMFVGGVFIISACIHPQEFWCIIHGFLYFLAIPAMSMILMLYALGNLHVVSWGTRENKSAAELEQIKQKEEGRLSGILSMFNQCCAWGTMQTQREDDRLRAILDRLDGVESGIRDISLSNIGSMKSSRLNLNESSNSLRTRSVSPIMMNNGEEAAPFSHVSQLFSGSSQKENPMFQEQRQTPRDRMVNPYWIEKDSEIGLLKEDRISADEVQFWRELIDEYLKPLDADKNKEKEVHAKLIELRNKVCLIFILINSLFIIVVFSLQQVVADGGSLSFKLPCADEGDDVVSGQRIEPISVAFTLVFGILLFVQFICMLMHRMATLLHICASTEIFKKKQMANIPGINSDETAENGFEPAENREMSYEQVYEFVRDMQKDQDADGSVTSESSIGTVSEVDDDEDTAIKRKEVKERWKKLAKRRRRIHNNTLGVNFKRNLSRMQSAMKDSVHSSAADDYQSEEMAYDEINQWKQRTHFKRMRNKSIHVLAMMANDPKMKQSIGRKEIIKERKEQVARAKWKVGAVKARILNQDSTDSTTPKKKISIDMVGQVLMEKREEERAKKALQEITEATTPAMQRHEIQIHRDEDGGHMYTDIDDMYSRIDDAKNKPEQSQSTIDMEDDFEVQPPLIIPKVEDDVWPEEDNYVVANETVDVFF